jgi:hypothetical protein
MRDIYGPNTAQVERFIGFLERMTDAQANRIRTAENGWRDSKVNRKAVAAAYMTDRSEMNDMASNVAVHYVPDFSLATVYAVQRAAVGLVSRDLISPEEYAILVDPFVKIGFGRWVGVLTGEEEFRLAAEIRTFYGTGPEAKAAFDLEKAEILE